MGRGRRQQGKLGAVLRSYGFEFIALVFLLGGIFLVAFEPSKVGAMVVNGYTSLTGGYLAGIKNLTAASLSKIDIRKLAGWLLFILAGLLVIWRAHARFMYSRLLVAEACPRCGGPMIRIHRTNLDRLWCSFTRIEWRRYRCESHTCMWTGLRRRRHHHLEHERAGSIVKIEHAN